MDESEVHVQLLMPMEQRRAGNVVDKIELGPLGSRRP
jgi:hypothetical protein